MKTKYYQVGGRFNHLIKTNEELKKPILKKGLTTPKNKTQSDIVKEQVANGATSIDPFDELLSAPSKSLTYLATGSYQNPSDALNIKNPIGRFATDAVLDPTNLLGLGLLNKVGKAGNLVNKTERVLSADKMVLGYMNKPKVSGNYFKNTIPEVDNVTKFKSQAAERLQELSSPEGHRRLREFSGVDLNDKQISDILSDIKGTDYQYINDSKFTGSHASKRNISSFNEMLYKIRPDLRQNRYNVLINGADSKPLNASIDNIWNHEFNHVVTNAVERVIGEKPLGTWTAGMPVSKNKSIKDVFRSTGPEDVRGETHKYFTESDEFPSHLAELRSRLKEDGYIKHNYENVSPEKMKDFLNNSVQSPNASRTDGLLLDHLKSDLKNNTTGFSEILKQYNKLPATIPALFGTGAVANELKKSKSKKKYYNGGKFYNKNKGR